MTLAGESDMAFAGAMEYNIDKEEFWQLSSDGPTIAPSPSPAPVLSGAFSDEFAHPRFSSDSSLFDHFVDMEIEAPAGTPVEDQNHHSPGESFFIPLSPYNHYLGEEEYGLDLGVDGLSPPASASSAAEPISVTSAASSHYSHMDDDHQSVDLNSTATSIPSLDGGSTKSHTSLPSQRQTAPRQGQQIPRASGATTNHVVLGHLDAETLEQRRRLLSGRRGMSQLQPVGGSISDSELLRLEGLSVNSPHGLVVGAGATRNVPSSSSSQTQLHRSMTPSTASPPLLRGGFPLGSSKSSSNLSGRNPRGYPATTSSTDDIDLCNLNGRRQNFKTTGSRKFESIYATIRRAVGGGQNSRGRLSQLNNAASHQNQARTPPIPHTVNPSHMESAKRATRRLATESQLMWDGLPISPPLTDMNNNQHSQHDSAAFVAGLMDDPFFDSSMPFGNQSHRPGLAPAAEINGKSAAFNANIPHTPLHTPNLKTETLGGDDGTNYFPTSSEPWSLDGTSFATSSDMSSAASFLSGDSTLLDAWNFDPASGSGSAMDFTHHNTTENTTANDGGGSAMHRNHHNLTIQVPSYVTSGHQHHQTLNHHHDSSDDLASSWLMIHMPQPRTPSTAPLLSSQIHQTHNGIPLHDASVFPFPDGGGGGTPQHYLHQQQQQQLQQQQQKQQQYSASRRPKPRAPSSGARYHTLNNNGGAPNSLSPRKTRQPSSSSELPSPTPGSAQQQQQLGGGRRSRPMAARRQMSLSQLNGGGGKGGGPHSALAHRKSTTDLGGVDGGGVAMMGVSSDTQSHAVRKRRSAGSWRGSSAAAVRRSASGEAGGGGGGSGGGGSISLDGMGSGGMGGGIGFVNYTPSDHSVLMTGVAPSGSSKTKARREKEAEDKRRKLSEAMMRMASDAGVDVAMLKEEGIVI